MVSRKTRLKFDILIKIKKMIKTWKTIFFLNLYRVIYSRLYSEPSPDIAESKDWCSYLLLRNYDALVAPERRTRLDLFRYIFDNFQGIILKFAGNNFLRLYTFRICKKQKTHFFKISR